MSFTENRIRVLPQNERALHVFLTPHFGAHRPRRADARRLERKSHRARAGAPRLDVLALTLFGVSSAAWSVRDPAGSHRLNRRLRIRAGGGQ